MQGRWRRRFDRQEFLFPPTTWSPAAAASEFISDRLFIEVIMSSTDLQYVPLRSCPLCFLWEAVSFTDLDVKVAAFQSCTSVFLDLKFDPQLNLIKDSIQ